MYLAPLNYDRFFKKVFSNARIAKRFLEDFMEVKIETIELLKRKHTITDSSATIEFDFRCKIDGQYSIIDMQQWYKADVVKRFYLYNAVNSTLQLETLPKKEYPEIDGKKFDTRSYNHLLPITTLIWMSDDSLGFNEDYISYSLYPEQLADFLKDEALWASGEINKIDKTRQYILTLLNNKTKNLDFLPKNRLIFAFQKNIVKNQKLKKYVRWFELAEKTRNKNNVEADFEAFKNDDILMEVMDRLETQKFEEEELSALEALERELTLSAIWKLGVRDELKEEVREEVKEEVREEVKEEVREEVKEEVREEVKEEVREEVKEEVREEVKEEIREEVKEEINKELTSKTVISAYKEGLPIDLIVRITGQTTEEINAIIKDYNKHQ